MHSAKKKKENISGGLEAKIDVLAKLVCKDETKERTEIKKRTRCERVNSPYKS